MSSHNLKYLPKRIFLIYADLVSTFFDQFRTEDDFISSEARVYLSNPSNKKLIEEAVQDLKRKVADEKRSETVNLENEENVVLTID